MSDTEYQREYRKRNLKRDAEIQAKSYLKHRETRIRRAAPGQKIRYLRNRAMIDALKSPPCTDCGGQFPPCAMDFDHRDPSRKRASIGKMVTGSADSILEEIAKCDLVCSNCHRVRTHLGGR